MVPLVAGGGGEWCLVVVMVRNNTFIFPSLCLLERGCLLRLCVPRQCFVKIRTLHVCVCCLFVLSRKQQSGLTTSSLSSEEKGCWQRRCSKSITLLGACNTRICTKINTPQTNERQKWKRTNEWKAFVPFFSPPKTHTAGFCSEFNYHRAKNEMTLHVWLSSDWNVAHEGVIIVTIDFLARFDARGFVN